MTELGGHDPFDELRRADPADPHGLPSASLARVRARVQEATIMDNVTTPRRGLRARAALGASGLALAALALIAVAVPRTVAPGTQPSPTDGGGSIGGGSIGGGAIGRCVENYSLDTLRNRDFAFDGTVTEIRGHRATFAVTDAFSGPDRAEVKLTAEGMTGTTVTSLGGPTLTVGGRYLVAGNDDFAWPCGFTQEYNAGVAAMWAAALGG
ncbi:hypothetical protein BH20CHL6_BH20CHL6_01410 [soil metagenome]